MNSDPLPFDPDDGADLDLWWAIPGILAGMPMPLLHPDRRERAGASVDAFHDDLTLLASAGIGAVVNLLNVPGDNSVYETAGFGYHAMPIPDGYAPSLEQFMGFLHFMAEQRQLGRAVVVHCAAGLGRTGTVLAGYLISRGVPVDEAISRIRTARPGAIETYRQLRFLHELKDAMPTLPSL